MKNIDDFVESLAVLLLAAAVFFIGATLIHFDSEIDKLWERKVEIKRGYCLTTFNAPLTLYGEGGKETILDKNKIQPMYLVECEYLKEINNQGQ